MIQYITDSNGETTGVFIPYNDWEKLVEKYKLVDDDLYEIPEWHKQLVMERIENAKKEDYIPWEIAKKKLTI